MKLPKTLRAARERVGLSQAQVADKLDVSASTYADWELGNMNPRLDRLAAIARVLQCEISELLA